MRTLGLLGGMSWESTVPYYQLINQRVRDQLGGLHSAKLLLHSGDFAEIERMQQDGDWDAAGAVLADAAGRLEGAGAEAIVLCTNTMHKVAPLIEKAIGIPLLHIADATAARVHAAGVRRVALLGTRFTMEQDFYRDRIEAAGIDVVVPGAAARERIHRVIYDELCLGLIRADSRDHYLRIIEELVDDGAEGVILGCTEIGLLIKPADTAVPAFDTTAIHAEAAADWATAV